MEDFKLNKEREYPLPSEFLAIVKGATVRSSRREVSEKRA